MGAPRASLVARVSTTWDARIRLPPPPQLIATSVFIPNFLTCHVSTCLWPPRPRQRAAPTQSATFALELPRRAGDVPVIKHKGPRGPSCGSSPRHARSSKRRPSACAPVARTPLSFRGAFGHAHLATPQPYEVLIPTTIQCARKAFGVRRARPPHRLVTNAHKTHAIPNKPTCLIHAQWCGCVHAPAR